MLVQKMTTTKKQNKKLIERYPFLLPHNRLTDRVPDGYDYSYTELDDMPDGWRIAFGEELCEEIRNELLANNCLDKYRIAQIKEKFGKLRWYDFRSTRKIACEIIPKYMERSAHTCIICGKPATRITLDWISPYRDDCLPKAEPGGSKFNSESVPIEEYYEDCIDLAKT